VSEGGRNETHPSQELFSLQLLMVGVLDVHLTTFDLWGRLMVVVEHSLSHRHITHLQQSLDIRQHLTIYGYISPISDIA